MNIVFIHSPIGADTELCLKNKRPNRHRTFLVLHLLNLRCSVSSGLCFKFKSNVFAFLACRGKLPGSYLREGELFLREQHFIKNTKTAATIILDCYSRVSVNFNLPRYTHPYAERISKQVF
jgi:hypothetical protein